MKLVSITETCKNQYIVIVRSGIWLCRKNTVYCTTRKIFEDWNEWIKMPEQSKVSACLALKLDFFIKEKHKENTND